MVHYKYEGALFVRRSRKHSVSKRKMHAIIDAPPIRVEGYLKYRSSYSAERLSVFSDFNKIKESLDSFFGNENELEVDYYFDTSFLCESFVVDIDRFKKSIGTVNELLVLYASRKNPDVRLTYERVKQNLMRYVGYLRELVEREDTYTTDGVVHEIKSQLVRFKSREARRNLVGYEFFLKKFFGGILKFLGRMHDGGRDLRLNFEERDCLESRVLNLVEGLNKDCGLGLSSTDSRLLTTAISRSVKTGRTSVIMSYDRAISDLIRILGKQNDGAWILCGGGVATAGLVYSLGLGKCHVKIYSEKDWSSVNRNLAGSLAPADSSFTAG